MRTRKLSTNVRTYPESARLRPSLRRRVSATDSPSLQVSGFRITESRFSERSDWARHSHECARLFFVLEGHYSETYESGKVICQPGTLRYVPAGATHSNSFETQTRCLIVEIEPEMLQRVEQHTQALSQPGEVQGPVGIWLAQRLHEEFQARDESSLLSMHGILLELLAETARRAGRGPARAVPGWLQRAREYVEANFLRPLSLAEIARVARVNRVHLARQFRSYFSTSVGEYIRLKRVQQACRLVTTTSDSLAEIAIDCGFSDQSHFSTTFRRHMGLTPARFREQEQKSALQPAG